MLPYHQMARVKYTALCMADTLPDGAEDMPARLERSTAQLRVMGLNVYHD